MLGILLIYFIGKPFYDLAQEYKKNEWAYAILGVVMYYVGTFVAGIVIGLGCYFMEFDFESINDLLLSLIAMPFGLFFCWLLHTFLKKKFSGDLSDIDNLDDTILDEGL